MLPAPRLTPKRHQAIRDAWAKISRPLDWFYCEQLYQRVAFAAEFQPAIAQGLEQIELRLLRLAKDLGELPGPLVMALASEDKRLIHSGHVDEFFDNLITPLRELNLQAIWPVQRPRRPRHNRALLDEVLYMD
jgi:hypothetical protein